MAPASPLEESDGRGAAASDTQDEGAGDDAPTQRRYSRLAVGVFVVLVIAVVAVFLLDWQEVWETVQNADLRFVLLALGLSFASYGFLSFAFAWVARFMGIELPRRNLFAVGFISSAINNVLAVGGLTGHSLRLILLRGRGVPTGDVLAATAFHSYLTNFILLLILPFGLVWMVLFGDLPDNAVVPLAIIAGVAVVLMVLGTLVVFHADLRRATVGKIGGVFRRFMKDGKVASALSDFDETMEQGTRVVQHRKGAFAFALLLDTLDWAATVATLGACFAAFGESLPLGVLATGFVVGIVAGLVSFVPGGFGVMEASMAGVFVLLGVPFALAAVATLLFRVLYHLMPFGVAVVFYARLLQRPFHLRDIVGKQSG